MSFYISTCILIQENRAKSQRCSLAVTCKVLEDVFPDYFVMQYF